METPAGNDDRFDPKVLTDDQWKTLATVSEQFRSIFILLMEDLNQALALARKNKTEYAFRSLVRTFFAFEEGMSHQLREVVRTYHVIRPGILRHPDVCALEKLGGYRLDEVGVPVQADKHRGRKLETLLFNMRCYAKVHFFRFEPDVGKPGCFTSGWQAMHDLSAFRDQITHPITIADLQPLDVVKTAWGSASDWLKSEFVRLMRETDAQDQITLSTTIPPQRI